MVTHDGYEGLRGLLALAAGDDGEAVRRAALVEEERCHPVAVLGPRVTPEMTADARTALGRLEALTARTPSSGVPDGLAEALRGMCAPGGPEPGSMKALADGLDGLFDGLPLRLDGAVGRDDRGRSMAGVCVEAAGRDGAPSAVSASVARLQDGGAAARWRVRSYLRGAPSGPAVRAEASGMVPEGIDLAQARAVLEDMQAAVRMMAAGLADAAPPVPEPGRRGTLADALDAGALDAIAGHNAAGFYRLRKDLVAQRRALGPLDRVAGLLRRPLGEVAELERYWSDPTVSELQAYALAMGCMIDVKARPFRPGGPSGRDGSEGRRAGSGTLEGSYARAVKAAMGEQDPAVRRGMLQALEMSAGDDRRLGDVFARLTAGADDKDRHKGKESS